MFENEDEKDNNLLREIATNIRQNPEFLSKLLMSIGEFSKIALESKEEQITLKTLALEQAIHNFEDSLSFKKLSEDKKIIYCWRMTKEYFTNGHARFASNSGKAFFKKFVGWLSKSKRLIDSEWAKDVGCNDYLKLVLKENEK